MILVSIKRVTPTHLKWIDDFFNGIGIKYFVIEGPCLSIIRGGNTRNMSFPDNQDMDVYILKEDQPKNLAEKMMEAGWRNRYGQPVFDTTIVRKFKFYAWRWDGEDECALDLRFLFKYQNYRWSIISDKYCMYDEHLFRSPRRITVQGVTVSVPDPTEEYLRQEYGDDWRTPSGLHFSKYPCVLRATRFDLHSKLSEDQRYKKFSP